MCCCKQDFREQLYLTDIPRQYLDIRTAEERKYPQLFRHRQEGQSQPAFVYVFIVAFYYTT